MKGKNKKFVIVPNKLTPNQINNLSMCVFIVQKDKHDELAEFILNNGGRVVSSILASGAEKHAILDSLSGFAFDHFVVMAICPEEIVETFMYNICKVFEFNKKKKGLAFMIDIDGYMGAKGPFVE